MDILMGFYKLTVVGTAKHFFVYQSKKQIQKSNQEIHNTNRKVILRLPRINFPFSN